MFKLHGKRVEIKTKVRWKDSIRKYLLQRKFLMGANPGHPIVHGDGTGATFFLFQAKSCPEWSGINVHYQLFSFGFSSSQPNNSLQPIRIIVRHNLHGLSRFKSQKVRISNLCTNFFYKGKATGNFFILLIILQVFVIPNTNIRRN